MNVLQNIVMDLSSAIIEPEETLILRLVALFGKSFGFATAIESQAPQPQDLVIQVGVLAYSFSLFMKSATPVINGLIKPKLKHIDDDSSVQDIQAFKEIFQPIGFSVMNYNVFNANGAFDWIDVSPKQDFILSESSKTTFKMNTDLDCLTNKALEGDIYWLQSGSIEVLISDVVTHKIDKSMTENDESTDPFNDLVFEKVFETDFSCSDEDSECDIDAVTKWVRAGDRGATLLKINREVVLSLIENDAKLCNSIQNMIFHGVCHEVGRKGKYESWLDECEIPPEECIL